MDYSKEELHVHSLFPTPIAQSHRDLTSKELEFLEKEYSKERKFNSTNELSKDNRILDKHEMNDLRIDLTAMINNYLYSVWQPANEIRAYITASWLCFNKTGDSHNKHNHGNSIISGVYYIDSDETDRLNFLAPKENPLGLYIRTKNFNLFNSPNWWLPTPKGSVLLFPSSLFHYVEPTINPNTRISLAFNTYVKGQINDEDQMELVL